MRTKTGQRLGVLGVLIAGALLAVGASTAQAGDGYGRSDRRGGYTQHDPYYAGTLRIGNRRFVLSNDTFVRDEITYRFRKMGFNAWSAHEKVYIRVGYHHRPIIRWLAGSHRVSTWYEGDCLVIKVIPPVYGHGAGHARKPYRPGWRNGRSSRRGPWRSGREIGRAYARGSIGLPW